MSGEVISLNVGGTVFVTSVATLTQYPDSMLAAMFNPESERSPAKKDGQGNYFIDRDPKPFEVILSFLRRDKLSGDMGGCTLEQLEWEADYFRLEELLKIIGERKKAEEERKADEKEKEYREKAAEMGKKSAEAEVEGWKLLGEMPEESVASQAAWDSANAFRRLASEYEEKAAELGRRGGN